MSSDSYKFLFAYPNAKQTLSARKVHIRRLYDILELSIHRNDLARAKKAWAILVRCKEVNWKTMWRTGALLVGKSEDPTMSARDRLEYLTTMMLQFAEAVRSRSTGCSRRIHILLERIGSPGDDTPSHSVSAVQACPG